MVHGCLAARGVRDSFQGHGELWVLLMCPAVTDCTGVPAGRPHTQREVPGCPLSALQDLQALGMQYPHLGSLCLLWPVRGAGGRQ